MPEGRMLSKSISHSEQLAEVSIEADYLFARCIPHLDREGRMTGHPALIKATACPLRAEITAELIPDLLRMLSGAGLVRWYEADGKQVLQFPGFKNHQRGTKFDREAASRFPEPPSEPTPDEVRTNSGPSAAEVRVSRSEVEGEVEVNPPGDALARVTLDDPEHDAEWEEIQNATGPLSEEQTRKVVGELAGGGLEIVSIVIPDGPPPEGMLKRIIPSEHGMDLPDDPPGEEPAPEVPGDTGSKVVPIRTNLPKLDLPFSGQDWDGRLSGSHILAAWIKLQPAPPSRRDRDRFGVACKKIADDHPVGEVALAFHGMKYLWPYAPSKKNNGVGDPWTPEDLLKVFPQALAAAAKDPQFAAAKQDREFKEAVARNRAGGLW